MTDSSPVRTTYAYDALNRLSSIVLPDGRRMAYTYDAAGNLVGINASTPSAQMMGSPAHVPAATTNVCPHCRAPLTAGVRFCGTCGAALSQEQPTFCAHCGRPLARSARFCPHCGKPAVSS